MEKIVKIVTIAIIVLFIALCSKDLLPTSKEINDMDVLKLIGLDYDEKAEENEKASLSCMINKEEGEASSGSESNTEKQKVISYKSKTFNNASRTMQFYTDKTITGSHINYFIVGEQTAKEDINKVLDQVSRAQEIRLTTHIYLVKDMTAYDFLKELVSAEYELSNKLQSIEKKGSYKTVVNYLTISELLSSKLSESKTYLIPTLNLIDNSDKLKDIKEEGVEESKELEKNFDFYGYGIMKDNKLIDYLNLEESIIYNMLINKAQGGIIDIEDKNKNLISFGINDIKTTYDYKFDKNNKLSQVIIKLKFRSNFEEVQSKEDITKNENIYMYQYLQEEKIKKQVEQVIEKTQKINIDILNIGQNLKIKHPYKYRKVKSEFEENYKNLDIKVDVESTIDRTYDII